MNISPTEHIDHGVAGTVRILSAAILLIALSGCATPQHTIHFYDGPELPEEDIASLEYSYPVKIVSIDGESVDRGRLHPMKQSVRIHLKPGSRNITAQHGPIYLMDEEKPVVIRPEPVYIETELKAGIRYRLLHRIGPAHEGVDIWIEELKE